MKTTAVSFAVATLLSAISATSVSVVTPTSLQKKIGPGGELNAHIGHFGHIEYGSEVTGRLHYPVSNRDACSPFNKADFNNDYLLDEQDDMTPILLIDEGGCSDILKVNNA